MAASDELPIPDYDSASFGDLQHRLRTLTIDELEHVLSYERAHAARPAVIAVAEARAAELHEGQEPSAGAPDALRPDAAPPPSGGDRVSPATSGPPINPPSQGVPSNPAQPR